MTSPMANSPMLSATNSTPLASSIRPNVKRVVPEKRSSPIVASRNPANPEIKAFIFDAPASKMTRLRPSNMRLPYSGGPNTIASCATSGAMKVRPMRPTVPAMNEPIAAMPRAAPALPCRAI